MNNRWLSVFVAVAIFLYVVWPLDLIPDVAFPIGFIDDAVLIGFAVYQGVNKKSLFHKAGY